MKLYKEASLMMLPTSVKDGKLYSIFPQNGDGDFTFSRGADRATRVTEQGLVRPVEIVSDELVQNGDFEQIGSELITNGGFDTDSVWIKGTGWSIGSGVANANNVPNLQRLQQDVGTSVVGNTYKYSISVSNVSGFYNVYIFGVYVLNKVNTEGTIEGYVTATSTNGVFWVAGASVSGLAAATIDNISVKEVGQNWTFYDGWSFEDGKATFNDSSTNRFVQSGLSITSGNVYKINFTISNCPTTAHLTIFDSGGSDLFVPNENYVNGEYARYYTATTNETGISFWGNTAGDTFSIDNISIVEVTEATDLPRLDWSGDCPSLLLEPQRTNLVTYSEDFSQWSLGTGGISIDTGYLAPDGSNNATKVTMDSNFSTTALSLNIGLGTTETRAIYARTVSGTGQAHLCSFNGNTDNLFTITEEWQRFEVNGAISTGATNFYAVDFRGSTDLNEIIIWGAQSEVGSYATSYIPTRGQAATRAKDIASSLDFSGFTTGEDFTMFVELADNEQLVRDNASNNIRLSDSVGSNFGSIRIYRASSIATRHRVVFQDNAGDFSPPSVLLDSTNPKVAIKRVFATGEFKVFVDGVLRSTGTSTDYLAFEDILLEGGGSPINVKELTLFDKALSDNECINLTSI